MCRAFLALQRWPPYVGGDPSARGETIIDEWYSAKLPAPPQLKPVTLEPKTTALLVMDFTVQTCTVERRKRCADSVPKVKKFVEEARAKGALIIYSVAVPKSVPGDVLKELDAGAPAKQVLPPLGPDKFINSDLEKTLHDKGITTVVAMGTAGADFGAAYRRRGGVARL